MDLVDSACILVFPCDSQISRLLFHGNPVKLPPKKAISMVSRFRFSKVDNQVSMVFSTSSPVTAFCLAVIFFWLQKMQSLGAAFVGDEDGYDCMFFHLSFYALPAVLVQNRW